jgi:hypothetical protein
MFTSTRQTISGFIAASGAVLCVLCLFIAYRTPGEGPALWAKIVYYVLAVFELVPMVGGVLYARNESPLGKWLVWFSLAVPILMVGIEAVKMAL